MKKILHIISSPRGNDSNSTLLGNRIIEKLQQQFPMSTVTVNNVVDTNYEPLQSVHIDAFRLPEDSYTQLQKNALRDSEAAIADLFDADFIIISLPLYNFGLPAALKAWIDHIVRPGKTFSYQTGQPEGLLKGKKAYLAIASSGVYTDGPMKPMDHAEPYLRFILGFIGLTDMTTYRIEGTVIPGVMETAVQKGLESVMA